jgi:3-deoxy-manno-octulosonate cytidylyltransferase (CMP-KDO synthetase)
MRGEDRGREDVMSVNNVKCVLDVHGYALYFSRALIPHNKKGVYDPNTKYMRKVGNLKP